MDAETTRACHELLLRLAGRLPDRTLWRYRDWLGEGAMTSLARALPRTLLKHDVDLNRRDHGLLVTGLVPYGADWHHVSMLLADDQPDTCPYTFSAATSDFADVDAVSAVLTATLRGRRDVGEVRECWRQSERGETAKRILLVVGLDELPKLAGELQRVLRVLGEEVPSVEVLDPRFEVGAYHRAALGDSARLCVGAVDAQHQLVAA